MVQRTCVSLGSTLLLLASMLAAGAAGAQGPLAGELLVARDPDALLPLTKLPQSILCYIDDGDTGGFTLEDPVILRTNGTCTGTASRHDVRLSGPAGPVSGKVLGSGIDEGRPLKTPESPARFWYHDQENTGSFSPGDTVYVKMRQVDENRVRTTDVRITPYGPYPAGSSVESGDSDQDLVLKPLGTPAERARYVDQQRNGALNAGDLLYLTATTDPKHVGVGDIRLIGIDEGLPYGERVMPYSWEVIPTLTLIERTLCHLDTRGSGVRSPADPIYLSLRGNCNQSLAEGDLRLSRTAPHSAGSRVQLTDPDHGQSVTAIPDARLVFVDVTNSSTFSRDDLLLVQLDDPGSKEVRPFDLLITPTSRGAGAVLLQDDELIGTPVIDIALLRDAVAFIKTGIGTNPGPQDPLYLSPGAKTGDPLRPADIRLVEIAGNPTGGPVGMETGEIVPKLKRQNARVCTTGDPPYDFHPGDSLYLRLEGPCPTNVQTGLLRLIQAQGYPAFSTVESNDGDLGTPLTALPDTLEWRFHDANGDGVFNPGDTLYLDLFDLEDKEVKRGDIRITRLGSWEGGKSVNTGDFDWGFNLTSLGRVNQYTAYVEVGSLRYAYITPDKTSTHAQLGDLRLTSLQEAFQTPAAGPYLKPVAEDQTEQESEATPPPPNQSTDDHYDYVGTPEHEEPVPTISVLGVILLLLGSIAWRRKNN
jgi:hypothetical protein